MRTLLVLLLVVVSLVAVRWFRGWSGVAQAGGEVTAEGEAAQGEARFLVPPKDTPKAPASAEAERATAIEASAPVATEPQAKAWPANLLPTSAEGGEEIAVAAALIHATPAEVQAAAAAFPKDRALLLESFAWAVAGERQVALSLSEKITDKEAIEGRERALFESALTGRAPTPASTGTTPVALAMELSLLAKESQEALTARQYPEAARGFSSLLKGELGAPWAADRRVLARWTDGLNAAQREHRWSPRSEWPAATMKVEAGDSLIAIRMRFLAAQPGARMCTGLIERANRLKGFLQPGQVLKIPTDPVRVYVDLEARWALFFLGEEVAAAWPVGVGRPGEETPPGDYTVRSKLENPPWMKEGQEPIPFGDPRNPLGTRWIGWSKEGSVRTSYGFHGTWEPESIGLGASDGCVRFLNADVEELFQILPEGAPIRIEG